MNFREREDKAISAYEMKNGQSGAFHLIHCQFPSPDLDLLPLTKGKGQLQLTPSLKSRKSTNGHFFTRNQTSAKDASTELGPAGPPWTIPRGQRPNPKVWRKIRSSAEAFHSEGKLSFNGTSLLPTNPPADVGMGCPCPNEVFCQHPSDPHQI